MKLSVPALALLLAVTAVGCDTANDTAADTTAAAYILADADLVTFRYAASAKGVLRDLAYDDRTYTVLAPTNEAFTATAAEQEVDLTDVLGRPDLGRILLVHVIRDQSLAAADLTDGQQIQTESGTVLTVVMEGERVGFDADGDSQADAYISTGDISASNGMVHKVDAVFVSAE